MTEIRYDRRVSEALLSVLGKKGVARSLVDFGNSGLFPLDLQLRRGKGGAEHATLYAGLTSVLDLHHNAKGQLRLKAHKTHADKKYGFDPSWSAWADQDTWRDRWTDVETYLERVIPVAVKNHGVTEGAVQAALSRAWKGDRIVVDREVTPSFVNTPRKKEILTECAAPVLDVLAAGDFKAGKVPTSFGAECDLLAFDRDGRILAVEVKPYNVGAIAWVAAQAAVYARVLQYWIDHDDTHPDGPREVLEGMLAQRQALGLAPTWKLTLPEEPRVVPVVALQRGAKQVYTDRMLAVRDALGEAGIDVELYEVSMTGTPRKLG